MTERRSSHFQRVQRKRYAQRSFRNPYFQPKRRPRWIVPVAALVAAGGVGAGAWALFASPALAIKTVRVEGNETIAAEDVTSAVWADLDEPAFWLFRRSNRLLFDAKRLTQELQGRFSFADVEVGRHGSALDVRVRERQSQLLWRSGDAVALVDDSGTVIRLLSPDEVAGLSRPDPAPGPGQTLAPIARLKRLRLFTDADKAPVSPGTRVLSGKEAAGCLAFEQHLLDQGIAFTQIQVDRSSGAWMAVKTLSGYDILFDPLNDVDGQATRLAALFRDTVKSQTGLTYVDLRFGDHVYYK